MADTNPHSASTLRNNQDAPNSQSDIAVVAAPQSLPERISRYRVERVLGRGGFGLVYLAYDEQLSRRVAIKVPHPHLISRPEEAESYLVEARTVANLDHPHIVPVYDVGSTAEIPFFVVSKYIAGTDLATKLKQSRLSQMQAAELVATVADALHCAHKQGLVHRDVKPGNILIDETGNAFVVDFGLALREGNVSERTRYAGTPSYMSPEQARGEGHRIDGRSDIFSLGIVLYELMVGRRPFKAEIDLDVVMQVVNDDPRPPRQYDETISADLERICLKALSKRASDRYTTAFDLAEDLRHFLGTLPHVTQSSQLVTVPSAVDHAFHESSIPVETPVTSRAADSRPIRIVPKGLRSFDAHDADFFLELLPGPRDRDGLPEGIRFWKTRLEETDADETFSVGLIYGPSGCGKSSLMKAGLLPRLSDKVIAVYVEATTELTEARLLNGLRKRCPTAPENLTLKETLAALRRGQGLSVGKKVVIVLDQFEQWLHARKDERNTELMQALRQCDGGRVQCVVMVRDDFWMAATRFMRELEVRLLEGQNSAAVDLFDIDHARKVLSAFGRAFGRIPQHSGEATKDQKQFLEQAVSGLAQEGKVISVRLALFAEMMKSKVWTPATLKAVGGTEGVGLTFLEETFSAATAPPEHRYYQKAARAVLKALLPETGTHIKGHMRSYAELLQASGYGNRSQDFDDVCRILDSEIRLITPTDPEGMDETRPAGTQTGGRMKDEKDEAQKAPDPSARYYQLTHDYLVHSLRDWLTRKQKETRRGRAELLLADCSSVWNARPENRQLPTLAQLFQINWLTAKKNWTAPQQKMMRKVAKYYAMRTAGVGFLLAVTTFGGLGIREYMNVRENAILEQSVEREKVNYAKGLVGRVLDANIAQVSAIVGEMQAYRAWTDSLLKEEQSRSANDPRKQLHISLALLPVDTAQIEYLYERMLRAEAQEVVVIREALSNHKDELIERLWATLVDPINETDQRFRAACALALFSPEDPRWEQVNKDVATTLVKQERFTIRQWADALRGIGRWLTPPLADFLVDDKRGLSERGLIASVYGQFAKDFPDAYVSLEKQLSATNGPDAPGAAKIGLAKFFSSMFSPNNRETPIEAKVSLAKRQASVGCALLVMNHGEKVWPLFKHSPDPTLRSFLIEWSALFGVDAKVLIARLGEEQDVSIKRAVISSLGGYAPDQVASAERPNLLSRLKQLYRDDPDAGIHGAADWLLRQWGDRESLDSLNSTLRTDESHLHQVLNDGLTAEQKQPHSKLFAEIEEIQTQLMECQQSLPVRQRNWERMRLEQSTRSRDSLKVGLVAHYPLDGADGLETASAVSEQPAATYQGFGVPEWTSGVVGAALKLDGTDTVVGGKPLELEANQPFSYGCWFQYNAKIPMILLSSREKSKGFRGFDLSLENDHQLRMQIAGEDPDLPDSERKTFSPFLLTVITKSTFDPKRNPGWHHVIVTYDGSTKANGVSIFVDGQPQPTTILDDKFQGTIKSDSGFYIGSRQWPTYRFQGLIDDVRIYNRRLDELEVKQIFDFGIDELIRIPPDKRTPDQRRLLANIFRPLDETSKRLAARLEDSQKSLRSDEHQPVWGRRWYLNQQGQTMVVIPTPGEISTGSGPNRRKSRIDRSIAIASKEVTVDQYFRFRKENFYYGGYATTPDCPMLGVSWYDAAAYCNWLSQQEGIPKDQWCYEPNTKGKYEEGMRIAPNFLQRTGYRMPAEAEWEYADRAGADTVWSSGDSDEVLVSYAWSVTNSSNKSHPVGTLRPNDLGLFDMHGNVCEWSQDVFEGYGAKPKKVKDENLLVNDLPHRLVCGGSFFEQSSVLSSGLRSGAGPSSRGVNYGIRLARTLLAIPVSGVQPSIPSEDQVSLVPAVQHESWFDAEQNVESNIGGTLFSPDGRTFVGFGDAGPRGGVRTWDAATGKQRHEFLTGKDVWYSTASYLPDGRQLVTWYTHDKNLYLWDLATRKVIREFQGHTVEGMIASLTPDGRRLVSSGVDKSLRLWNVESGKEIWKQDVSNEQIAKIRCSNDNMLILTIGDDLILRTRKVESGEVAAKLVGHTKNCSGDFSPNGKQVLSWGDDGLVRLWDAETGQIIRSFTGPSGPIKQAWFLDEGRQVMTWESGTRFRIWDLTKGISIRSISIEDFEVAGEGQAALSPNAQRLLVSDSDGDVRVLDIDTGAELFRSIPDTLSKAQGFSFSPDSQSVAAGSFRHGIYLFHLPAPSARK